MWGCVITPRVGAEGENTSNFELPPIQPAQMDRCVVKPELRIFKNTPVIDFKVVWDGCVLKLLPRRLIAQAPYIKHRASRPCSLNVAKDVPGSEIEPFLRNLDDKTREDGTLCLRSIQHWFLLCSYTFSVLQM